MPVRLYGGNMDNPLWIGVLISVVVFGVPAGIALYFSVKERMKEKARRKADESLRLTELARQANLPKLDTGDLLRVPPSDNMNYARTFGMRWNRIIVWDELGQAWVGFASKSLMKKLADSEYLLEDYWVPFCGPGEMFASKVVNIGDRIFELYPTFLLGKSPDSPEWQGWANLIKRNNPDLGNRAYSDFFPAGKYEEIRRIRKDLKSFL